MAALAGYVIFAEGRGLWGGYAAAYAGEALRGAQTLPRGAARDQQLDRAQASASDGLKIAPDDPRLWNLLAETRLQQSIAGGVEALSPALLVASAQASAQAAALAPHDVGVQARLGYVKSLQGDAEAAAAALTQSYRLDSFSPLYGFRRVVTAARAWRALDAKARRDVVSEACLLAGRSENDRARLYQMRMSFADPGLALALDDVFADPACKPI